MDEQIGSVYENTDRWVDVVTWADRRLSNLPKDSPARANALNGACWARAKAGVEPQVALKLCEEAMSLRPDEPAIRDSRALVRLRLGDWSGAVSDYDEVLKHGTNHAFALYGRGLAERRLGQTAKADADLAAAKSASPNIETIFPTIGSLAT
jgi:tetratricopeptide (TPR) repeat protein